MSRRLITTAILLSAGIFILDLVTPLGVAGGVPYVAVVLLSLWSSNRRCALVYAGTSTVLTITDYLLSAPGSEPWIVVANRGVALIAIWTTALFCMCRQREWRATLDAEIERNRLEAERRRHRAELAHASRLSLAGEMAAGLAHELNQPLGAICAYADALAETNEPTDVSRFSDTADRIATQARRASQIIDRVARFTRKSEPHRSSIDLNLVIREAAALLEDCSLRAGSQLSLDLASDLPLILADRVQIQQVIMNLAWNAFEAMADTSPAGRELIIRSARSGTDAVAVHVSDIGHGLADASLGEIFKPFFSTKDGGAGLGLAISERIIFAHGGRLWASSNPTGGATFHIELPVGQKVLHVA